MVVLEADGDAEVRQLRGEDWDFDDRWSMTGMGTWRLIESGSGETIAAAPAVKVAITKVTRLENWPATDVFGDPRTPLGEYTWKFGMDRTDEGLQPYYLAGDPDTAELYYLHRTEPG
ncbi:hypothetical protein [Streptomyces sp. NPDC050504]|uniref:hypothetical protein n=1 Tax=Streptomyces sp. NPDC050504 TaxID=3365618 RepID=UPI00378AC568